MPRFKYRAVDAEGKAHTGEASARDNQSLVNELRAKGLTALEIHEADTDTRKIEKEASRLEFDFGVSRQILTLFTRQLATTLQAGLSLLRIIHVLRRRNSSPSMRKVLEQVGQDLQKGARFSEALARHPRVFDEMYLNMIRVGEAGGSLPETVARLALMMEKEAAVRRKIASAMAYPTFILVFTSLLSYALVAFLMPLFAPMFEDSKLDIQGDYPLTYWLLKASEFFSSGSNMMLLVLGAILLIVGFRLSQRTTVGRYTIDYLKFYVPFFHALVQQGAAARFARCFSQLLQAGVPLLQSLSLVAGSAGNLVVARSLGKVARNIQEGDKISDTLESVKIFPDLMIQMAAIGEEAGSLPDMFERVADYYESEIDATIAAMTAVLEPAMMVLVGGVVGMFVMGVLLPILGISTGYQQQM
ncbi:MAG: type II secretion system F family protein [Candidatus Eremiobacterota bacterium]